MQSVYEVLYGGSPLVASAIHDGHLLRPEVAGLMKLPDDGRLREEDPHTASWTTIAENRIIGLNSRFEVDLNRPRDHAVYRVPEDCWGLDVWREPPPDDLVERSLAGYDAFYAAAHALFSDLEQRYGHFVVFDLHTYNHRRDGPDAPPAPAAGNPEVNVGTGTMNRLRWAKVVKRFMGDLRAHDYMGRSLDVRENVRFRGGQFARWTHEQFPDSGCVLSIEFKKFFMDEWTGEADPTQLTAIRHSLAATIPGVLTALDES